MDNASNANEKGDRLVIQATKAGMSTWLTKAPENINMSKIINTETKFVTIGLPVQDAIVCVNAALDIATIDNIDIKINFDRPNIPWSVLLGGFAKGSVVHVPFLNTRPLHPELLKKDGALTSVELYWCSYPIKL